MPAISQAFRCFDEVARRGSVRKAAQSLHLTAAAVNQQILNLEASVGVPLFDRLPRGMQLTTAGEIVVAAVRRCQRDFDNALSQVEDLRALRRGHVAIGVPHATAEVLLPGVLESVQASHPGISFAVRTGTGESLLRLLERGEVDAAYCLRRPTSAGLEEVRSWPQRLGVVTAPGHPLMARQRPMRLRDCLDHPLVLLCPDMELRTVLDTLGTPLLRNGRAAIETNSVPMARRLIAGGQAVGFLLPDNVADDVTTGRLVWRALQDPGARLHSAVYQRTGCATPVALALFLQAMEVAMAKLHASFEI